MAPVLVLAVPALVRRVPVASGREDLALVLPDREALGRADGDAAVGPAVSNPTHSLNFAVVSS